MADHEGRSRLAEQLAQFREQAERSEREARAARWRDFWSGTFLFLGPTVATGAVGAIIEGALSGGRPEGVLMARLVGMTATACTIMAFIIAFITGRAVETAWRKGKAPPEALGLGSAAFVVAMGGLTYVNLALVLGPFITVLAVVLGWFITVLAVVLGWFITAR